MAETTVSSRGRAGAGVTADVELMAGIVGGDTRAFARLYDQFAPRLFGLLVKLTGDRREAEDLLQEVFWQVWRKAEQYDAAAGPPAVWLLRIARNRAIDHLRGRRARSASTRALHEGEVDEVPGSHVTIQAGGLTDESTSAALELLPEPQRDAIELSFYRGLTHEQIASLRGEPLGTIKTRIRLGIAKLRDVLPHPADSNEAPTS